MVKRKTESYTFFYDESEHSRKINYSTIQADNYSNNFVTVILGYNDIYIADKEKIFSKLKNKYSSRLIKDEFKSKSLNLSYGFASLKKDGIEFLQDLLEVTKGNANICFSVMNKMEFIINQIFKEDHSHYKPGYYINMSNLRYSLSKSISLYRPKGILEAIYNDGDVVFEIKKFASERLIANESNLKLKRRENEMFEALIEILSTFNKNFKVDWNYEGAFKDFNKYLKSNKIKNYKLIIDKEGKIDADSETYLSAKRMKMKNVSERDSKKEFGIQLADLIAGIISKFIKRLDDETMYKNFKEATQKKLLSKEWFSIDESQFELYKLFYKSLINSTDVSTKAYSGEYVDGLIRFISLLKYFNNFNSFEEYDVINHEKHIEKYNEESVIRLDKFYKNKKIQL